MAQANLPIEEHAGFHQVKGGKAFRAEATARTRVWMVGRAAEFWEGRSEVWADGYLLRGTGVCKVVRSL